MKALQGGSVLAGAFALILAVMAAPVMAQNAGQADDIPGDLRAELNNSYIFVFNDRRVRRETVTGRANSLANRHGGAVEQVYSNAFRGFSAKMSPEAAARMAARNPDIAYYEADGLVRADGTRRNLRIVGKGKRNQNGQYGQSGNHQHSDSARKPLVDNSGPRVETAGVRRVGGPANGTGLTVWVLDTGIDLDHPDLNVDVERSRKFAGGRDAGDRNGHGTHVAGIIGAIDNEFDVIGVAAGATLVSVRVLRKNAMGRTSGVIAGVDYVAENAEPGDVVNMSLIGDPSNALDAAIIRAADRGILFAVAAGNAGVYAGDYSPARVEHPNVYTVSAVNGSDQFASFSNWGNPPVDFAAPGVNVLSSAIDGGTIAYSGTSMATPHVAGVLAITGGLPGFDGCAIGDPDRKRDPIVHMSGRRSC